MGQRIAVMSEGLLQQVGTPQQLYDTPINRFVAGFIGSPAMNFVELASPGGGATELSTGSMKFPVPTGYREGLQSAGDTVIAGFRPEHLELSDLQGPQATMQARPTWSSTGNEELLHVTVDGHEASRSSTRRTGSPGDVSSCGCRPTSCTCSPRTRALDRLAARGGCRLTSPSIRESGGRRVLGRRPLHVREAP
jgi:ABC-type sugar transport system ATPase subunit